MHAPTREEINAAAARFQAAGGSVSIQPAEVAPPSALVAEDYGQYEDYRSSVQAMPLPFNAVFRLPVDESKHVHVSFSSLRWIGVPIVEATRLACKPGCPIR